jgi:hypothetical protein
MREVRMRFIFSLALSVLVYPCLFSSDAGSAIDALIRERILTATPDRAQNQVYPTGAVMVGDLFGARVRMAIGVSRVGEQLQHLVCFVHRQGDWQEIHRQVLGSAEQPFLAPDASPLSLLDLDGDRAPELLITEQKRDDLRLVSVWRYDKESAQLPQVGAHLKNPQWQNGVVRGTWKLGVTNGDVGAEEHVWRDGRLQRVWSAEQRYPLQEYLIGTGEPTVRVEQQRSDASQEKLSVVGNLAHARLRLPVGEQPRDIAALITEERGRSRVKIIPRRAVLEQYQLTSQWDSLISTALFTDPLAFSRDMVITLPTGKKIPLSDIAEVISEPSTLPTTFHYLSIDDETRRSIEESAVYPAIALSPTQPSERASDRVLDWSRAILSTDTTLTKNRDITAYIRLPNVSGYPLSQIETGTVVTDCAYKNKVLTISITCAYGSRSTLATKDVIRPLISLNLGTLTGDNVTLRVVINGLEQPHELQRTYTLK